MARFRVVLRNGRKSVLEGINHEDAVKKALPAFKMKEVFDKSVADAMVEGTRVTKYYQAVANLTVKPPKFEFREGFSEWILYVDGKQSYSVNLENKVKNEKDAKAVAKIIASDIEMWCTINSHNQTPDYDFKYAPTLLSLKREDFKAIHKVVKEALIQDLWKYDTRKMR